MRDWIVINGRKILWDVWISVIDDYRYKKVIQDLGEQGFSMYCSMITVIQELTDNYHNGYNSRIDDYKRDFRRNFLVVPEEKKLPEALEELFNQIQGKLKIDLSALLDKCVEKSEERYKQMLAEEEEKRRGEFIKALPVKEDEVSNRVSYLMNLQRAKVNCSTYEVNPIEERATNLWCEVLITSISSDVISIGVLKRAEEMGAIEEAEIEKLLRDYGIEKDYEWYLEEYLGCELDNPTDINVGDFLEICETRFAEIIGCRF